MDVFISWTRADEDVKNVLGKKLQDAGITYWDSDQYCTSDFAEECIAAIKRCSVFIAIVSDASMEEGYVQNEITTARNLEKQGKLNILVYKITDAPYTDKFEFLLNHISFVTGNMIQRVSSVSGVSSLDTIVSRAQVLLKRRAEGNPEKPFDVHIPEIDGLKLSKTGYFVEGSRDDILQAMNEGFTRSNVLIMTEFFGYGKRSAIRKFVESSQGKFSAAVMVQNTCRNLREFLAVGLNFSNVNDNAFGDLQGDALLRAKFKFLAKLDERTLLVIPDVHFEDQPDAELCEMLAGLKCRILLLTQESADAYVDWFPVIGVGRMQDCHLYELFFHHYARAYEDEKESLSEPLSRFFANIGGHTKTVELTAATLNRDMGVMPEDVPRYLSMQGGEGIQLKDRILQQIGNIFDAERLGDQERIALLVAAYLAVPYISERNYRTVLRQCGVENWQVVIELDKLRWLDVDIYNRTVSMEPLVAQIVLSKLPEMELVALCCLEHLIEMIKKSASFSFSDAARMHAQDKLAYFFMTIGLPECAEILTQLRQNEIEGEAYDAQNMAKAIARFEAKYPPKELTSIFTTEEDTETADDDGPSCGSIVEDKVLEYMRVTIPGAKLIAKNLDNLMFDFSSESNRIMNRAANGSPHDNVEMVEFIGIRPEEFDVILEYCREEMQNLQELNADDVQVNIAIECMAMVNAFYVRDYLTIQTGIYNLVEHLSELPPGLLDEGTFEVISNVFQMVCKMYFSSGAYPPVIMLCEKFLCFMLPPRFRFSVLYMYVNALRKSAQYTKVLYDAYDEMLRIYDKTAQEVFELRTEQLGEKKSILLMYAEDLAKGEMAEQAMTQFAAARKLDAERLRDEEILCAQCIVDVLVKTGSFQQALTFIDLHFPEAVMDALIAQGSEKIRGIMEEFAIYRNAAEMSDGEFTENSDPRKHVSYYQAFSRKNNSLLEQKYFNAADQALDYDFSDLTLEEITAHADQLRKRAKKEKMLRLAPEAFALASEAGFRILGYRHHLVQYMGAAAMAEGKISEILNGEGKTYTILLTAFLHSLYGKRVYVIDQSPYLTGRNHQWMTGVYDLLGVSNAHITQYDLLPKATQSVIYADLRTLIFGFLHCEKNTYLKRGDFSMDTVIIDEADTTLVDEASQRFQLVSYETAEDLLTQVTNVWAFVESLSEDEEYFAYSNGRVTLQPAVYPLIEAYFRVSYEDLEQLDQIRTIERLVSTAVWCHVYAEKDRDYFIRNGVPVRENKTKGVFEPFNSDIYYFLCAENDLDFTQAEKQLKTRAKILNLITLRDFFKRFDCVCGTTATAVSFRDEFRDIYGLDCFCVPPHSPVIRQDLKSPLYLSKRAKEQAIMELVQQKTAARQPVLIVTQSTGESERYSRLLKRLQIAHKLLNAKNAEDFSDLIVCSGVSGSVLVTNALAGRGADIKLGGNPELKTRQELVEMGEDIAQLDSFVYTLPTSEQMQTPLYQKYHSILEKNKALCAADRQAVVAAGGLCVIGTSFFPEPRTEQQTRGRSGRQGNVGESWVFQSVEDEELQGLISPAMLTWIRESVLGGSDIQELDVPILQKAIQSAQKQLHKARFAAIRKMNSNDQYIDKARADFIGTRFALTEGQLNLETYIRNWTCEKAVLEQLRMLQKGESSCSIAGLNYLFKRHPQLSAVSGSRASAILYDVICRELDKKGLNIDQMNDALIHVLCNELLRAWEEYIVIVQDTVGRVNLSDKTLGHFLEEEKQRLLRSAVEVIFRVRLKKPEV